MALDDLVHRIRPAEGAVEGALFLMHGRGVDENDLFPLLDLLDPERRLTAITPRAPLRLPGQPGNHWYVVERVGYPGAESFWTTHGLLGDWLDSVSVELDVPPERIVLGGFSQGGGMAYAMGLDPSRPAPAAILALSCFVPTVERWEPDLAGREALPVYDAHGVADPIIGVEFGRAARDLLKGHVDLTYREHPGGHTIDPRSFDEMREWLAKAISRRGS